MLLPPRPAEGDAPEHPDEPLPPQTPDLGGDPSSREPEAETETEPVAADAVRVTLRLQDGSPVFARIQLVHASTEQADGDQAEFSGIQGPAALTVTALRFPRHPE